MCDCQDMHKILPPLSINIYIGVLHSVTLMTLNIINLRDLKEIDKKILKCLIEDSHQSLRKIAETLGTTRQNISQRIKKLQEKNLIKSYSINFNTEIIDELRVNAYILFREDPDAQKREEHDIIIAEIPQIIRFSRLFGKYDGIIEIFVKNIDEITEVIKKLHDLVGIKETETFIIHTTIKDDEKSVILNLL